MDCGKDRKAETGYHLPTTEFKYQRYPVMTVEQTVRRRHPAKNEIEMPPAKTTAIVANCPRRYHGARDLPGRSQ